MIVKERKVPLSILKLQALARRTHPDHPKFQLIKENLAKSLAGYKGEAAIDYPLSPLPEKNYLILHDMRLQNKQHYFQMDTLLLSQSYLLILEVKNMSGTLPFDNKFKQLIRTLDGKQESYPYPLVQIQQHEDH
ncbi:nuclease-related domain-containing protein [Metabacillus herbersteinensis]|uniref:Nuclease-related domain-containing protein n=1 Tax=Metabacillus herbersteinensis TaxID=283816 RepID=A0ABV6G9B1_9BACI